MQRYIRYLTCILLHLALVVCHAILVEVSHNGHPLHLVHDTWYTTALFSLVSYAPNLVGKGYLVVLLYETQKLALRRNLNLKQNLTAAHDKSTAWLGLGSAIPVLFNQFFAAADIFGSTCILLYLAGIFALGVTFPILFTVGEVANGTDRFLNITQLLPALGQNEYAIADSLPIVEIVPLMNQDLTTYGLDEFLVYDIPNFSGLQPVSVDATRVSVDCKAIPNAVQVGEFNENTGEYSFQVHQALQDVIITPSVNAINIPEVLVADPSIPPPPVIVIGTTLKVVDQTSGTTQSEVQFSPAVIPENCGAGECPSISSLQLLACDVDMFNITGVPVVPLFGISDTSSIAGPNITSWTNWELPQGPTKDILSFIHFFGGFSPPSARFEPYHVASDNVSRNRSFSVLEENVLDTIDFYTGSNAMTLAELNAILERAIAAVYWRAAMTELIETHVSNTVATDEGFRYNVQIHHIAPSIGLAFSVLMTVLAIIMTRPVRHMDKEHKELGQLGVLQLTWLLAKCPSVSQALKDNVADPKFDALRKEGLKIDTDGWSASAGLSDDRESASGSEKGV